MPFQATFTNEDLSNYFSGKTEINSSDVKAAASHFNVQVQSLTKRLNKLPNVQKAVSYTHLTLPTIYSV